MPVFADSLHDEFASWVLGFAPYGAGDVGEVELLAIQTKPAFHLQMETFDKFAMLGDPPAERVQVRYEGTTLPIRCPTLITSAESDPASSNGRELYEALRCPKGFLSFLDADGAGMHCEMQNRSMASRQILDWLDDTLQAVE